MSYIPLNFELMKNPFNWVILALMVVIAGMALALVTHPAAPADTSQG